MAEIDMLKRTTLIANGNNPPSANTSVNTYKFLLARAYARSAEKP